MQMLKNADDFMKALENCSLNEEIPLIKERDTSIARACADVAIEIVGEFLDHDPRRLADHSSDVQMRVMAAVQYEPDPRREALGRKLYEALNPDGTPWDEHGEPMHERYRAAAEAVRDE
jgi:hypothetical protein